MAFQHFPHNKQMGRGTGVGGGRGGRAWGEGANSTLALKEQR